MSTRIREFRKLRGMTLHFLAQKVGTTAQTIQRLETGNMTVSLDWLERIAGVFGMPAAALLVSDNTASVPVIGTVDVDGALEATPSTTVEMLSLVVAARDPIAVRVAEQIDTFAPGTVLIFSKVDFDRDLLMEAQFGLVGYVSGSIVLRRIAIGATGVALERLGKLGGRENGREEIAWVAPLKMAIRYF